MQANIDKWLSYRRELSRVKVRLFCFPFGGGGASTFIPWLDRMPSGVEVCPVQAPGRENRLREAPITRMSAMIELLIEALTPFIDCPFALFGHSIGALTMFELARQLRRQGLQSPCWLFASGHPAPDLPRRRPAISHLARPEFTAALREDFDLDPALLDSKDIMDMIFPALRADYELVETYVHQAESPFSCPLSVFGGSRDPETTEDELMAWSNHTTGSFRTQVLEGKHMFIQTSREALIGEISRDLAQVPALKS